MQNRLGRNLDLFPTGNLCAISTDCVIALAHSPVDIKVTAPDGKSMTSQLSEIPAASYTAINEPGGHSSAVVIIPFAASGDYSITVSPKPDASPTDTYTLEVSQAGQLTVLAQDVQIQSIPPLPYTVLVLAPVNIDIKPGSFPNSVNPKSAGRVPVAILSTTTFDAPNVVDRQSLTFGRLGDEQTLLFCNSGGQDVNGDGLLDLMCHFNTKNLGLLDADTHAVLRGKTIGGVPFMGSDSVAVINY
jgi:hypothetical protein